MHPTHHMTYQEKRALLYHENSAKIRILAELGLVVWKLKIMIFHVVGSKLDDGRARRDLQPEKAPQD